MRTFIILGALFIADATSKFEQPDSAKRFLLGVILTAMVMDILEFCKIMGWWR